MVFAGSSCPEIGRILRVCVEHRALNAQIKSDSGGLGDIAEMHDRMHGSKLFTSLNMAQPYHQWELKASDRRKTGFLDATWRLMEFTVCSFGLMIFRLYSQHTWEMT